MKPDMLNEQIAFGIFILWAVYKLLQMDHEINKKAQEDLERLRSKRENMRGIFLYFKPPKN